MLLSAAITVVMFDAPSINAGGVVYAASSVPGPVVPGSVATVYGNFLVESLRTASIVPWPTILSGLSVQFANALKAPLYYVSPGQMSLQIPWELAGQPQASMIATFNGQTGPAQIVNLVPFAPGIFSTNSQGNGQGAILDSSYRLVDQSNPAEAGKTYLQIYGTGLGEVDHVPPSGSPAPSAEPLSRTPAVPEVMIGGKSAKVSFSGLAPGFVGIYQVNAKVPQGVAPGRKVPVVLSIGGVKSNTVTIAVAPLPTIQPSITSLLPSSAPAGSDALTLTINGAGFLETSSVTFNGSPHAASFVDDSRLTIHLSALDLAKTGEFPVLVTNPSPGAGISPAVIFTVSILPNPQPSISSISPASATAGTGPLTLTVNGSGFISNSTVSFLGLAHAISFVSGQAVQITLSRADLAEVAGHSTYGHPGSIPVFVVNPPPGGGTSNSASFTIDAPPLTGPWRGTWSSTQYEASGTIALNLFQSGNTITGEASSTGSPCFAKNGISATLKGDTLSGTFSVVGGQTISLTALVDSAGNSMSGIYKLQSGPCAPAGDSGSISLARYQ